jgi:hypothetical protein
MTDGALHDFPIRLHVVPKDSDIYHLLVSEGHRANIKVTDNKVTGIMKRGDYEDLGA